MDDFFIRTSHGIIRRNAVSYIKVGSKGSVCIYVKEVGTPIYLREEEGKEFVKFMEPLITLEGATDNESSDV